MAQKTLHSRRQETLETTRQPKHLTLVSRGELVQPLTGMLRQRVLLVTRQVRRNMGRKNLAPSVREQLGDRREVVVRRSSVVQLPIVAQIRFVLVEAV